VASDIQGYLRELQAALAGTDPALVQDALFDAEEHLHAELAAGHAFADIVDHYGTPAEVAAAYLETSGVQPGQAATPTPAAVVPAAPETPTVPEAALAAPSDREPSGPPQVAPLPAGPAAGVLPIPPAPAGPQSVWREVFGVFIDSQVWKSLLYMLISLGTGIAYFTIVVTMFSTSMGTSVLIVGLPLLLLTLAFVRGMALAEGRLVEGLLGIRMPRRPRAEIPGSFFQRLWFWLKDGRTWASMVYLVLMLPLGVVYFVFAVTGIATGLGLIAAPFVQLGFPGHKWVEYTINGVEHFWVMPVWTMPLSIIVGFLVLLGWFHAFRWIGRGHATYAKAMLVRLAK
jgi:hypothetical protein